jgi:hypothetical protein
MKRNAFWLLLLFLCFVQAAPARTPARIWKSDVGDDRTVHSLGNGQMLVYEQGPQIINLYPGPFSTPSFFKVSLISPLQHVQSMRETGAAIWTHDIVANQKQIGRMIDFVDANLACLVRHIETQEPLEFKVTLNEYVRLTENRYRFDAAKGQGGILLQVPTGTIIYQTYVYPRILHHQIAWQGRVHLQRSDTEPSTLTLRCEPGVCDLFFVGGPEYPQVIQNTEEMFRLGYVNLLQRTGAYWREFTESRTDFRSKLRADLPLRDRLLQVIDDIAVLIKTQQAVQGSVMAGYPYPLGYVRDQYGVSRGLLALGCYAEARAILDFYWQIWKKFGKIHNAQTIGLEAQQFHIHENDDVESTGYLIIQAFDFLQKTGDEAFVREITPMLQWAFEAQKKHLANGMLPFNGDETYIAGGLLPRTVMNDGSAEATMLFVDGGEKLLSWMAKNKIWNERRIDENKRLLQASKDKFLTNFWRDGHVMTNNPTRAQAVEPPRFRHGVCERAGEKCLVFPKGGFAGITWTERDSNGRYQCANCLALGPYTKVEPKMYDLVSVSLTPIYFHSALVTLQQLQPVLEQIIDAYIKTGKMPGANRSVGYEYGLVLYAATQAHHDRARYFYEKTLSLADPVGAWSEYYLDDKPQGTRCRPWESAINLEALLQWASR